MRGGYLTYLQPFVETIKEKEKYSNKLNENVKEDISEYIEECKKHLVKKGDKNYYINFNKSKCKTII